MSIPESQLDIWSKQGSVTQSASTYKTIKLALEEGNASYSNKNYSIFLQGSYGNDTNVFADSDVDVVIKLNSCFYDNLAELSESRRTELNAGFSSAEYGIVNFKQDVLTHLKGKYKNLVEEGNKAIYIKGEHSRREADIVVAVEYRRFYENSVGFDSGICFFSKNGTKIVNYPQQHSANCVTKHQSTNGYFKPMVRILKNMRNKMSLDNLIEYGSAPSYFLEGMLYNVPDESFGKSYDDTFVNCVNWLLSTDRSKLVCANGQYYLLHKTSPVTWREENCNAFLASLADFWTNY